MSRRALQGDGEAMRRLRLSLGGVEGTRVMGPLYSQWGTLAFLERKGVREGLSRVRVPGHTAPRAREGPAWIQVHRPVAAAQLLFALDGKPTFFITVDTEAFEGFQTSTLKKKKKEKSPGSSNC